MSAGEDFLHFGPLCGMFTPHGYSLWVEARQKPRLDNAPWHGGNEFSFSPAFRNCFRISYMYLDDLTFPPAAVYLGKLLSQAAETS